MNKPQQRSNISFSSLINILIFCSVLSGCSSNTNIAPIEDSATIPSYKINTHKVAPGETVYSIAWRYGVDYKQLAKVNGLDRKYSIWPGQELSLDVDRYAADDTQSYEKPAPKKALNRAPVAQAPKPVVTPTPTPIPDPAVVTRAPKPTPKPTPRSKNQSTTVAKPTGSSRSKRGIDWYWPLKGALLVKFDQKQGLNKGIDIKGELGESVLAAADGEVVYAGSGLRGYGKLVIVKHNDKYLSAYAHNKVLIVKEGAKVRAGQKIAEVGRSGDGVQAKLHFEIRFDGVPVDPLSYLPR